MSLEPNQEVVSHVLFGLDPLWVSTILFVVTYVVIVTHGHARDTEALAACLDRPWRYVQGSARA